MNPRGGFQPDYILRDWGGFRLVHANLFHCPLRLVSLGRPREHFLQKNKRALCVILIDTAVDSHRLQIIQAPHVTEKERLICVNLQLKSPQV